MDLRPISSFRSSSGSLSGSSLSASASAAVRAFASEAFSRRGSLRNPLPLFPANRKPCLQGLCIPGGQKTRTYGKPHPALLLPSLKPFHPICGSQVHSRRSHHIHFSVHQTSLISLYFCHTGENAAYPETGTPAARRCAQSPRV